MYVVKTVCRTSLYEHGDRIRLSASFTRSAVHARE